MKKTNWEIKDAYKDWTLERNSDNYRWRIKWGNKVFRSFSGCNRAEDAIHFFNKTVKEFF